MGACIRYVVLEEARLLTSGCVARFCARAFGSTLTQSPTSSRLRAPNNKLLKGQDHIGLIESKRVKLATGKKHGPQPQESGLVDDVLVYQVLCIGTLSRVP